MKPFQRKFQERMMLLSGKNRSKNLYLWLVLLLFLPFQDAIAGEYKIAANPRSALLGTPIHLEISGCRQGEIVILRVESEDGSGTMWESRTTYRADKKGKVNIAKQDAVSRDYQGIDGLGPFWSMKPVNKKREEWKRYSFDKLEYATFRLSLEVEGVSRATAKVERLLRFPESEIAREAIDQDGLLGTLFFPRNQKHFPGLIYFTGSGGGLSEEMAALLASHGFAALALAYFGTDPLPKECVEIPLEYFAKALHWLEAHEAVDRNRIGVMGGSKGGELALLLGSMFPAVKAVVGIVPSGIVWQGISQNPFPPRSSWSKNGNGLPFVAFKPTPDQLQNLLSGKRVSFREWYNPVRYDPEVITKATMPVENIKGPLLLLSGTDDQMWPSDILSEMVMKRLKDHNHSYPDQHLCYQGAGHGFYTYPYMPASTNQIGRWIKGGNPQADAKAVADAWPKVMAFLKKHLGS